MADKLLIPCLYLQSGKAVTGFGQRNLFGEGNIEDLVRFTEITEQMNCWFLTFRLEIKSMIRLLQISNRFVRLLKFLLWQLEISIDGRCQKASLCRMCQSCSEFFQRK